MAGRVLLAAVISAVLMFLWGFLFWGVSGATNALLSPLPGEADITAVLRRERVESGMYVYPAPLDPSEFDADEEGMAELDAEFNRKHQAGPIFQIAVQSAGAEPMDPKMFAAGLVHNLVIALLAGTLVALAGAGLNTFGKRFAAVLLITLVAAIWGNGSDLIWWSHPLKYCLGKGIYELAAGVLMAVVIAALVKPRAQEGLE